MASVYRHSTLFAAIALAGLMIVGAYLLARGAGAPRAAQASSETALLQAIATKDSDGDGLPDWEEALYGTDPNKVDSFNLGMTDGEAVAKGLIVPKALTPVAPTTATAPGGSAVEGGVPAAANGTLTDAFGKNFFTLYIQAKEANNGNALSSDQISALAQHVLQQLLTSIVPAPDFKSSSDLTVGASGSDALKQYAASAEAVFSQHTSKQKKSELEYLQDLIGGDQSAVAHLQAIAAAYKAGAAGLAVLPVPSAVAAPDLALVNALARIGDITLDFSRLGTDPIATMFALEQYPNAVLALGNAFTNISKAYAAAGVVLPAGTPGAAFVGVMSSISTSLNKSP